MTDEKGGHRNQPSTLQNITCLSRASRSLLAALPRLRQLLPLKRLIFSWQSHKKVWFLNHTVMFTDFCCHVCFHFQLIFVSVASFWKPRSYLSLLPMSISQAGTHSWPSAFAVGTLDPPSGSPAFLPWGNRTPIGPSKPGKIEHYSSASVKKERHLPLTSWVTAEKTLEALPPGTPCNSFLHWCCWFLISPHEDNRREDRWLCVISWQQKHRCKTFALLSVWNFCWIKIFSQSYSGRGTTFGPA